MLGVLLHFSLSKKNILRDLFILQMLKTCEFHVGDIPCWRLRGERGMAGARGIPPYFSLRAFLRSYALIFLSRPALSLSLLPSAPDFRGPFDCWGGGGLFPLCPVPIPYLLFLLRARYISELAY